MVKYLISILFILFTFNSILAQDSLKIQLKNSTKTSDIKSLNKIYFVNDSIIFAYENSSTYYQLSTLMKIYFCHNTKNEDTIKTDIYPNPCISEVTINGIKSGELFFFNSGGLLIKKISYKQGEIINVSDLQKGLYFLYINRKTFKIIKT